MKGLICLSLSTLALWAQQPPREVPPVSGKATPFRVPTRQTTTLNSGLRISAIPWGTIPKMTIRAVVLTGSVHEQPNQIGLAQLTVALMKEGAAGKSGAELAAEAARMGGDLRFRVTPDYTTFEISVLRDFSADAVKLVADVLRRPTFPEKELARLKADKVRELSVSLTSPQQIATDLFRRTLYPDHPYGSTYPGEKMVNGFTIEDVRSFYRRNVGAKRTHIYLLGRFDPSLAKAASVAFATWEGGPEPKYPVPGPAVKKQIITADRSAASQTNLRLGLRVPGPTHKDYTPLEVTNALLGGSFASRIGTNIREQKGYTYSPKSILNTQYHDAYWVEEAAVTTDHTGAALTEIHKEISGLRQEQPSEEELRGIQGYMAGSFVLANSSRVGIMDQLSFVDRQGLGDDWLRTWVQRVYAVTPADIQRVSDTYLNSDNMVLVVVGDLSKVRDQIASFENSPRP